MRISGKGQPKNVIEISRAGGVGSVDVASQSNTIRTDPGRAGRGWVEDDKIEEGLSPAANLYELE